MRYMMRWCLVCVAAMVLFACPTVAQMVLHGRVYDAETGEALSIAHIRVEGRFTGTITNTSGQYELHLDDLPSDISVTYIGYHSQRFTITDATPDSLDIGLAPNPVVLEEIVVTPEDPAVRIMREVIRRKQEWRAEMDTYRAEGYTRVTLSNEDEIATIMESISDVFWRDGLGTREIIRSKRQAENFDGEANFAQARIMPNLYDDDIEILGFDIIGLTHPDALDYYEFTLVGRRKRDDVTVFDIRATPKKRLQPSFVGTLSVLDEEFAVLDMAVKPNQVVMLPAPLNDITTAIEQQFDNFGGDCWLPVNVAFDARIKVGIPGIRFPAINYRQLTHLSGYEINAALSDSLFPETRRETVVSVNLSEGEASVSLGARETPLEEYAINVEEHTEDTGGESDSLFAASPLVIPFTEEEATAYAEIDSTDTLDKAFRPTGFIARLAEGDDTSSRPQKPSEPPSAFSQVVDRVTEPFGFNAAYNRVDGVSGGMEFEERLFGIDITMSGTYRDEPEDWTYGGGLSYRFGPGNRAFTSISFSTGTDQQYGESLYTGWMNTVSTVIGRDDYFNYFDNRSLRAQAGYRFRTSEIEASIGIRAERHSSRILATSYNVFNRTIIQRPNPPVTEGRLRSVEFMLSRGEGPQGMGLIGGNRIELLVEHSSPDMFDSEFEFTRAQIAFDRRVETFLKRRLFANTLDFRLVAGTSSGTLPPQRMGSIDGSFGVFSPFGVLRAQRNRQLVGERYAALFWEHNFRTVPFELLGLQGIARRSIGIILHGASAVTSNENPRLAALWGDGDEHHEIGLSVTGLFTLLRIDVTRRLDERGTYAGIGIARMF